LKHDNKDHARNDVAVKKWFSAAALHFAHSCFFCVTFVISTNTLPVSA